MTIPSSPSPIQSEIDALVLLAYQNWIDGKTLIWMLEATIKCDVSSLLSADLQLRRSDAQWGVPLLVDKRTAHEIILAVPEVRTAVDKLLSYKWQIEYQRVKWRAAVNVMTWLQINLIDTGRLTSEELRIIPLVAFRDFDIRLYQAIANHDRYNK